MSSDLDAGEPPSTTSDGRVSRDSPKVYDALGCLKREEFPEVIIYYKGPKGCERRTEARFPDGKVLHLEGPKNRERIVRQVHPNGSFAVFVGECGHERRVRSVFPNSHVCYYYCDREQERLVRMAMTNYEVHYFEGERGKERVVRALLQNGDVHFFADDVHYKTLAQLTPVRVEKKDGTSQMSWRGRQTTPRRSQLPRSWDERRALERMQTFSIYRKHTPGVYARFDRVYLRRCFKRFVLGVFANRRQVLSFGRIRYHGERGEKRLLLERDGSVVYYDSGPDAEVAVRRETYDSGEVYMQSCFNPLRCVTLEKRQCVLGRLNERRALWYWYSITPDAYSKSFLWYSKSGNRWRWRLYLRRWWMRLCDGTVLRKKVRWLRALSEARRIYLARIHLDQCYAHWRVWLAARHARRLLNETKPVAEGRPSKRTLKKRRAQERRRQSAPADDAPVDAESSESANPGDAHTTGASICDRCDHDDRDDHDGEECEECVLCMDAPREYALVPCGHRCICATCIVRHRTELAACPLCKAPVESVLRIFG